MVAREVLIDLNKQKPSEKNSKKALGGWSILSLQREAGDHSGG